MYHLQNRVQLIGNLGKDVEFKQLENGNAIARVTISTREVHKNAQGEKLVDTELHHLVGWGKIAEIMYVLFKKGCKVAIEGKLTHRYLEAPNGQTQRFSEVVVNEFMLINASNQ